MFLCCPTSRQTFLTGPMCFLHKRWRQWTLYHWTPSQWVEYPHTPVFIFRNRPMCCCFFSSENAGLWPGAAHISKSLGSASVLQRPRHDSAASAYSVRSSPVLDVDNNVLDADVPVLLPVQKMFLLESNLHFETLNRPVDRLNVFNHFNLIFYSFLNSVFYCVVSVLLVTVHLLKDLSRNFVKK